MSSDIGQGHEDAPIRKRLPVIVIAAGLVRWLVPRGNVESRDLWHRLREKRLLDGASNVQVMLEMFYFAASLRLAQSGLNLVSYLSRDQRSGRTGDQKRNGIGAHNLLWSEQRRVNQNPARTPAMVIGREEIRSDRANPTKNANCWIQTQSREGDEHEVEQEAGVYERTKLGSDACAGYKGNQHGGEACLQKDVEQPIGPGQTSRRFYRRPDCAQNQQLDEHKNRCGKYQPFSGVHAITVRIKRNRIATPMAKNRMKIRRRSLRRSAWRKAGDLSCNGLINLDQGRRYFAISRTDYLQRNLPR